MRVIAGSLGGRTFESPHSKQTHPMSDKIRGALFNALGDISGLTVLDAFAGSGALSIEAISRGASHVTAIDIDSDAFKTIVANIAALNLQDVITPYRKNINGWARSNQSKEFDIVLCDSPYDDIRPDILQKLVALVKVGGVYVVSWPSTEAVRPFVGLEFLSQKSYGNAQLVFYRKV